jgi:hypothetical protein
MAPVASADVMAITKWSISRLESGMAGCCAYAASGQAPEREMHAETFAHQDEGADGARPRACRRSFRIRPPEIGAPIGITEKSVWYHFVDARNVSFCRLSRHGQDCSQGVARKAKQKPEGEMEGTKTAAAGVVKMALPSRLRLARFVP